MTLQSIDPTLQSIDPTLQSISNAGLNGSNAGFQGSNAGLPPTSDGLPFWPPKIVWSRTKGFLAIRDPSDATWFEISAREAPEGWVRQANAAKYGRRRD